METEKKENETVEVAKELIGWENNKVWRTVSHLMVKPGEVIKQYCEGERTAYLSPVVYFFGVTALETFLATRSGLYDFFVQKNFKDLQQSFNELKASGVGINTDAAALQINDYTAFLISETGQKIILIPIILLLSALLYNQFNKSFKHNSWFALYTLSQISLLGLPAMLVWYVTQNAVLYSVLALILAFPYVIFASKQFYDLSWVKAILIRLLLFVLLMFSYSIIFVLIGVVVALNSVQ